MKSLKYILNDRGTVTITVKHSSETIYSLGLSHFLIRACK